MIGTQIHEVQQRIKAAAERSGRDPQTIQILAVSKRKPIQAVREAMSHGQLLFGENYLQDAKEKINAIGAGPSWHFIGHLQSNKARQAAELFHCIETVDKNCPASQYCCC